jgi:two-component system response regulator FixJ
MLVNADARRIVHVVDDDESVRRSLDFLMRKSGYWTELWTSGEEFLKFVDRHTAACALIDVRMPGRDGLQILRAMVDEGFDLPVIMLTGHGDVALAVDSMRNGAFDFIEKPFEHDRLLTSLEEACKTTADRETIRQKADWARMQLGKLTDREREVLDGLACGYPNKTIAYDLGISARTVEVYRANVMAKLVVGNFADALRIAFAAGLGSERAWLQRIHPQARARSV